MNISIIGAGYAGLVTGACLASQGMDVLCCDTDEDRISRLKKGILPIYEPKLSTMIENMTVNNLRLDFTSDMEKAVNHADILFITVNTPANEDGACDLSHVFDAVKKIAVYMNCYKVIVNKSTVPVGTGLKVKSEIIRILKEQKKQLDFDVASNPEFLKEGSAVDDFISPERLIIGAEKGRAVEMIKAIYADQIKSGIPVLITDIETAEMIKYASNAFLATRISFINELANICELCRADVTKVAEGMGLDSRIGHKFLNPGPGFGGSCFPKDIRALSGTAESLGYTPLILNSVIEANTRQRTIMTEKIKRTVGNLENRIITILGISFKPDTDDIREAPSIPIIKELLDSGAVVKVYDPKAMENLKKLYPGLAVTYCPDIDSACTESCCIVLVTEWKEFCVLDFNGLKSIVRERVLLDLRNVYDPSYVRGHGFYYEGVGRA